MRIQLKNISSLAKDIEVKNILSKYFNKPLHKKNYTINVNTPNIKKVSIIGSSVETFLHIHYSKNNAEIKERLLTEIESCEGRLKEYKDRLETDKLFLTNALGGSFPENCFCAKSEFFLYLKKIQKDPSYIQQMLGKRNSVNLMFLVKVVLENKGKLFFIKSTKTITESYELTYSYKSENVKLLSLTNGDDYLNFLYDVLGKYKKFIENFDKQISITLESTLLILRATQLIRSFGYGYLKSDFGYFSDEEVITLKNIVLSIPRQILDLGNNKIKFEPLCQYQHEDKLIQGRPDFLNKDFIVEIKSTNSFFALTDFYQVLLYYYLIKFSSNQNHPKKALLYYSKYSQTIELDIESLITNTQMEWTEKALIKYFKNIQTI